MDSQFLDNFCLKLGIEPSQTLTPEFKRLPCLPQHQNAPFPLQNSRNSDNFQINVHSMRISITNVHIFPKARQLVKTY